MSGVFYALGEALGVTALAVVILSWAGTALNKLCQVREDSLAHIDVDDTCGYVVTDLDRSMRDHPSGPFDTLTVEYRDDLAARRRKAGLS